MAERHEAGAPATPIAAQHVRALLIRHGVPPIRHVRLVAELLGFGYTQVHRRMNGTVAWEIEEIQKVAAHYGETLADVFGNGRRDEWIDASLVADGARIDCRLLLGAAVHDPDPQSLVALRTGEGWLVVAAPRRGVGPCYRIERLQFTNSAPQPRRIAILGEDSSEAARLAEYFERRGCETHAFTERAPLLQTMTRCRFDGFVIDWDLGEVSARGLVALIRDEQRECPIAILTGKLNDGVDIEMDVAEALEAHRLMFFEKPIRLSLLSSQVLGAIVGR